MILTTAVLDIDHGIVLTALVVAGRRVDHQRTPRLVDLREIPYAADLTARHVLHLEVVRPCLLDLDGTRPAATAIECLTGGIGHRHAVDNQEIVVESGHLRFGGHRPCAVIGLLHVVLRATEVDLNELGLRGSHAEHHAVVLQHSRIRATVDIGHGRIRSLRERLPAGSLCGYGQGDHSEHTDRNN